MMRKVIIVAGLILFMVIGRSHGQEKEFYNAPLLGVKTNTLYWLTTTINIGAEIGLGKNTTIDLLGTYNPWSFGDNKKNKALVGTTGVSLLDLRTLQWPFLGITRFLRRV